MNKFALLLCTLLFAPAALAVKYFNPYEGITNMAFDLRSEQLAKLLKTKYLSIAANEEPYFEVFYVRPGRLDAVLQKASGVNSEVRVRLEQYVQKKMLLMIESNLDTFLRDYHQTQDSSVEKKYTDEIGLLEYKEVIVIKQADDEATLRLKKPLGTHRITYMLKNEEGKEGVLKSVSKKEFEGIGSNQMQIDFSYESKDGFYLPSKIEGKFDQVMRATDSGQDISRTIQEQLLFENFRINDNTALKWFSKKS